MYAYIRHHRLKVAPETQHLSFSFRSLMGSDLAASRRVYPEDYARIESWFPLVGVSLAQNVFAKKQEVRHERRRDQISER